MENRSLLSQYGLTYGLSTPSSPKKPFKQPIGFTSNSLALKPRVFPQALDRVFFQGKNATPPLTAKPNIDAPNSKHPILKLGLMSLISSSLLGCPTDSVAPPPKPENPFFLPSPKDSSTFTPLTSSAPQVTDLQPIIFKNLVEDLFKKGIQYFIDYRHPNGLVLDRGLNPIVSSPSNNVVQLRPSVISNNQNMASIAATGYGFTSWVMAAEKGIISKSTAEAWSIQALKFMEDHTPLEQHGWMSHFVDAEKGAPFGNSEISSIDTAIFMLGALSAGEYFGGETQKIVQRLFNKIDFPFMLTNNGTQPNKLQFSHGFFLKEGKPQFIETNWDNYSEGILLSLLSLGSTVHAVPKTVWTEGWDRHKNWEFNGKKTFNPLPLFTFYYPHGFFPLKGKKDEKGDDFWEESLKAFEMQVEYCQKEGYPEGLFGLTACDGPTGYQAFAPQPSNKETTEKTPPNNIQPIAPPAIFASLPFSEKFAKSSLKTLMAKGLLNGKYGVICAYDPKTDWKAPDAIGIDVGSTLLMMDASDQSIIHKLMEKNPIIRAAMTRAGYRF
jgi:hypothetical protein